VAVIVAFSDVNDGGTAVGSSPHAGVGGKDPAGVGSSWGVGGGAGKMIGETAVGNGV
jgi:hypothetical protein